MINTSLSPPTVECLRPEVQCRPFNPLSTESGENRYSHSMFLSACALAPFKHFPLSPRWPTQDSIGLPPISLRHRLRPPSNASFHPPPPLGFWNTLHPPQMRPVPLPVKQKTPSLTKRNHVFAFPLPRTRPRALFYRVSFFSLSFLSPPVSPLLPPRCQ